MLAGTPTAAGTVAGSPPRANPTDIKVVEAVEAAEDGATEIDMVANLGWLCENRFQEAEAEIRKVRRNLSAEIPLKVIIESSVLSVEQQRGAVQAVINAGAQFVKTCTGYAGSVCVDHVRTLVEVAHGQIGVKASGGIRTYSQSLDLLNAGAIRLGTSSSTAILAEARAISST